MHYKKVYNVGHFWLTYVLLFAPTSHDPHTHRPRLKHVDIYM